MPAARHLSEQNRTFSQSRSHFLRQLNGLWQVAQIFCGNSDFLRIFAMACFRASMIHLQAGSGSRPVKPPGTFIDMAALRFILGDQLSRSVSSLDGLDITQDVVLMVEADAEATYAPHHIQKITYIFSAMRHHAQALRAENIHVDYVKIDDPANTHSFSGELARAIARHQPERIIVTEPGEWRVLEMMRDWAGQTGLPVEIREDDRFLCSRGEFAAWAGERKSLRMEFFYREMRRKTGYLMQGDEPEGGQWNFDHDNRQPLPGRLAIPPRPVPQADAITREVLDIVRLRYPRHFGRVAAPAFPVTREGALKKLAEFTEKCLPDFGTFQDAMQTGEPFLFHSLISPALNSGLLDAREVCLSVLRAFAKGKAPINAVEGFIRQIIGWREYVRGIYWLKMPDYAETNVLEAKRDLPAFYWTADTPMACLREAVENTRDNAYAHHIQRLMITGNFALLAGIEPRQIEQWYLAVYADAYEWVELPNVHGMVMFADGGLLASKPYAASGAYIDRMSDYCKGCHYDVKLKTGPKACPFNYLYWNFLVENEPKLAKNPRMAMPCRTLAKMTGVRRAEIAADSSRFLAELEPWRGTW